MHRESPEPNMDMLEFPAFSLKAGCRRPRSTWDSSIWRVVAGRLCDCNARIGVRLALVQAIVHEEAIGKMLKQLRHGREEWQSIMH